PPQPAIPLEKKHLDYQIQDPKSRSHFAKDISRQGAATARDGDNEEEEDEDDDEDEEEDDQETEEERIERRRQVRIA
ncbi:hypothetical protein BGX23_007942, partial [Mortierella sp. AD031]